MDPKQELLHLLAHKGELHAQAEAIAQAIRDLDVLIKHLRAKLESVPKAAEADHG